MLAEKVMLKLVKIPCNRSWVRKNSA